ncbi:MAG TPA: gliding motility-associated C-terminal domain-containing protein, partial [Bacteroidetes bacterium]|nr:gliding motility-associated C-terminal domain-containing protein [Bacteroidota bacterium]
TLYYITITDNACEATDSILVTTATMNVSISPDTSIFFGESALIWAFGGNQYLWSPNDGLSCNDCSNPIASPDLTTEFTVIITDTTTGCQDSLALTVFVEHDNVIFIPNAFSPDNNGTNDIVFVRSSSIDEMTFSIYNRWGDLVFETQNANEGWDGTENGNPLQSDVYVYRLQTKFINGESLEKKGNISLIK